MKRGAKRVGFGPVPDRIHSLSPDLLSAIFASLDPFDLVRCSAVCKSWHKIIHTCSLLKDLYIKQTSTYEGLSNVSLKRYLEDHAMEEHRLSLLNGSTEIHQWNAHSVGVNQCRMKMGLVLTGVGDKVVRLWSPENFQCLGEYSVPVASPLFDFDFDESKIVGLVGTRLCIWKRHGKRSLFPSKEGIFTRGTCMRYLDPEAAVGCGDGTIRMFDMYSQSCSRIIRMHSGPVTCLALTGDQMVVSGSSLGSITVAGLSVDQRVATLKSSTAPTGIKTLCFNPNSHLVFAGSTNGYAHCWDLRTMRPLWEARISPNVLYSMQHMWNDTKTLVVGGIDGVLRVLNQSTGENVASYVIDGGATLPASSNNTLGVMKWKRVRKLSKGTQLDSIPRYSRPSITCLAVGMKKIVTAHNGKYIRMWKFNKEKNINC